MASPAPFVRAKLPAGLAGTAAGLGLGLAGLAALGLSLPGLGVAFLVVSLASFAAAALAVSFFAARHLRGRPFGAANRVTLVRVALAALLLGLVVEGAGVGRGDWIAWMAIALATGELMLDGLDGRLARRVGEATRFGARFDMETDAALILILAALAWQLGKVGPWVLAAGLMRYGFVAAGRVWSWLRAPLPPSRRRQAVCVVQTAGLLVVIAPFVPVPLSSAIAAATVATLAASFAIDVRWLARN